MLYQRLCPFCQSKLINDDIDYNFEGCQNELSICDNCKTTFEFKIRYFKVCNKFLYSKDDDNTWNSGFLSDLRS